jgi:CelD/BcsL family acetyltransferase involved in cellulose biosynthesis
MRGLADMVAREQDRAAVLRSFASWLAQSRDWDLVRLVRPQFESRTPGALKEAADQNGWSYAAYGNLRSTTYQLELPKSVEEWETFQRPKTRYTARREARQFEAEMSGKLVAAVAPAELGDALDTVERLLRARWGEGEVYFAPDSKFRALLHEAVPQMAANGDAWVSVARDPSGIHGVLVTLAQNGFAMALLVAADEDASYRKYSLGKHVFKMGIGEAVRRGCHNYDFLWVGGYKQSYWHAQPRYLESAFLGRGIAGRVVARLAARRESGPLSVTGGTAESTT